MITGDPYRGRTSFSVLGTATFFAFEAELMLHLLRVKVVCWIT